MSSHSSSRVGAGLVAGVAVAALFSTAFAQDAGWTPDGQPAYQQPAPSQQRAYQAEPPYAGGAPAASGYGYGAPQTSPYSPPPGRYPPSQYDQGGYPQGGGSPNDAYRPDAYANRADAYSPPNDAYAPQNNDAYSPRREAYNGGAPGGGYSDPGEPYTGPDAGGYGAPYTPGPAAGVPPPGEPGPPSDKTFAEGEVISAGHKFFGSVSKELASAVEYAFRSQGRPNGYILGEDAGGAFVVGLRYGEGMLYTKDAGDHKVYWQGPSLGYDAGAEGSKTMVLVYNLRDPAEIYNRFGGVQGAAYLVGGVSVQFQKYNDVTLGIIRSGVGVRLGANVGYLKYTRTPTWNPL